MSDPDMCPEIFKFVVLDHFLSIADNLKYNEVPAVGDNKGMLPSFCLNPLDLFHLQKHRERRTLHGQNNAGFPGGRTTMPGMSL